MTDRPSWDVTNQAIAQEYSKRGTCPRLQVGAYFVTADNRPLSVGYNGAPAGQPHCTDIGCDLYWYGTGEKKHQETIEYGHSQGSYNLTVVEPELLIRRCRRAIHSEINAIGYAAKNGISLEGSTLHLWPIGPCYECELVLVTVGIKEIVFPSKTYHAGDARATLLAKMGVEVRVIPYAN